MPTQVTLEYVGEGAKLIQENRKVSNSLDDLDSNTKKSTSSMSSSFKSAAGVIAGLGIASAIKGMFSEAKEAQQVSASTAQGIKTMGAEAWTSADAIGDLSTAISNKIGVDDEAIQSSANLLLTFGNVRNEVGAMNNIFDRGVQAAQDLSAKGFGDADSAAKMLGKALNDPLKGLTALGKAGVTFTDAQKEQIKAMVKSGDLLGAQKILLAEVERQVGGTAAATATSTDKMAVQWGNFQEKLGTELMPVLEKVLAQLSLFLDWAAQHQGIVIAIAAITAGIWLLNAAMNANPIILLISFIAALVVAFGILWEKSAAFRQFFIDIWNGIVGSVKAAIQTIKDVWAGLVWVFENTTIGKIIAGIFRAVGTAIDAVVSSIKWLVDRIRDAIGWVQSLLDKASMITGAKGVPGLSKGPGTLPKHHTGTVVPGMVGSQHLAMVQAGERITPIGQSGGTGGLVVSGSGGLFEAIQYGLRNGDIQLVDESGNRILVA